jgi:flagellar motor switch protein FliM
MYRLSVITAGSRSGGAKEPRGGNLVGILSQTEVDALVQSLVEQEEETVEAEARPDSSKSRSIKVYDFRSPDKFAREQVRTLYMLHDDFARMASLSLSGHMRAPIAVKVLTVEQSNYEEFLNGVTEPTIMCIFAMPPLRGKCLLEFDLGIGMRIIDRVFGGVGAPPVELRALTEIEQTTIEVLLNGFMNDLARAWKGTVELDPYVEIVASNTFHAQFLSSKEVTASIIFQVCLGEHEAPMRLCVPYYCLEPVLPMLSAKHWLNRGSREDAAEKVPEALAKQIPVKVQAELGAARLTLKELVHLQAGDVIALENCCDSPIRLTVEGRPKFTGQPGRVGQKFAIRIAGNLEEAGERIG